MKKTIKIFAIFFSVVILLTFCSCKATDKAQLSSSIPALQENSNTHIGNIDYNSTLLRRMDATNKIENIESIKILSGSCATGAPVLTNKNDFEFLQKYIHSHDRTDKKENWDAWLKENTDFCLEIDTKQQGEYYLYLTKDGSIAVQQMCGDSEVPEITYEIYTADANDVLTKEKLEKF